MFKKLLSNNRIFGAIVCVMVFIAGGLLYLQFVQRQAARDIQRTQEIIKQQQTPKTRTAAHTEDGGHWHGDEWHAEPHPETPGVSAGEAEPHTPQNTSEDTDEVQGGPVGAQPRNAQIDAPNQESSAPTQESSARMQAFHKEHRAWREKYHELIDQFSQLDHEMREDWFPKTVEEWKQYNANPEMWRKYNELWAKQGKVWALLQAHREKEPVRP